MPTLQTLRRATKFARTRLRAALVCTCIEGGWIDLTRTALQDRQCTHNVTLRRVRVASIAVERQQVLHILSVCL